VSKTNILSNRLTDQFVSCIVNARSRLVHEKDFRALEDGTSHAKQLLFSNACIRLWDW